MLAGTVTFRLDDAELTGGAGDFLLVPRGAAHTFGNEGEAPAAGAARAPWTPTSRSCISSGQQVNHRPVRPNGR